MLVAVPVVLVIVACTVIVVDRIERAGRARDIDHAMTVATKVGGVVDSLENEELTSVGFLLGVAKPADLDAQAAQTADRVADVEATFGDALSEPIRTALDNQATLSQVRQAVSAHRETPSAVVTAYSTAIDSIIGSLSLASFADTSTASGQQVLALDAMLRIDGLHTDSASQLLVATAQPTETAIVAYAGSARAAVALERELTVNASAAQQDLYSLVTNGYVERVGDSFLAAFQDSPRTAVAGLTPSQLYPELGEYLQLGRLVEAKIAADVSSAAQAQQRDNLETAYVVAGVAVAIVLLVLLMWWLGIRSLARSLGGLAVVTNRVADRTEMELRRVADDHVESVDRVAFDGLPVGARDEVGDFARVFMRAQRFAAGIVEEQVAARRNLAQMAGTAGRRGARLVVRQLAILDRLERAGIADDVREDIYRLDHLTTRLRRVTASVVALSESGEPGRHAADESGYPRPMALADVVRLACAESGTQAHVEISVSPATMLDPAVIDDAVLLLTELIANAAAFSPAGTIVKVVARQYDTAVSVVDEGIGMSDEQIATENARLAHPERLDLASSGALGLFVVGRLARRHGFTVTFEHTRHRGATVVIDFGRYASTIAPDETVRATAQAVATTSLPHSREAAEVVAASVAVSTTALAAAPGGARRPAPLQLDSQPFNIEAFERASEVLGAGHTWNAFEVEPSRYAALPPGSAAPALPGRTGSNGELRHDDVDVPRAGTGYSGGGVGPRGAEFVDRPFASRSGIPLARRGSAEDAWFARRGSADDASAAGRRGPEDAPAGAGLANAGASVPAAGSGFPMAGVARYVPPDGPSGESGNGPHIGLRRRSGDDGVTALTRRVPGATMPPRRVPDHVDGARTLDPDEARRLVEQFETGVARALGESAGDGAEDEGHG